MHTPADDANITIFIHLPSTLKLRKSSPGYTASRNGIQGPARVSAGQEPNTATILHPTATLLTWAAPLKWTPRSRVTVRVTARIVLLLACNIYNAILCSSSPVHRSNQALDGVAMTSDFPTPEELRGRPKPPAPPTPRKPSREERRQRELEEQAAEDKELARIASVLNDKIVRIVDSEAGALRRAESYFIHDVDDGLTVPCHGLRWLTEIRYRGQRGKVPMADEVRFGLMETAALIADEYRRRGFGAQVVRGKPQLPADRSPEDGIYEITPIFVRVTW